MQEKQAECCIYASSIDKECFLLFGGRWSVQCLLFLKLQK